jgi:hypothetical protein
MKKIVWGVFFVPLAALSGLPTPGPAGDATAFLSFRMQELETGLGIGYAVVVADVNHDGKPDIVVVDKDRVLWFENPSWKRRTIIEGGTKPDNVCIAAQDIDGDGKLDFALGADWNPSNTKSGGTLQWLKRGKTLDEPWSIYPIDTEPTIHRIRFIELEGDGKTSLVSVPLQGRGATAKGNFLDGAPVRVRAYRIPKDPTRDRWESVVLDESLHVCHNFCPAPGLTRRAVGNNLLVASYEGVHLLSLDGGKWSRRQVGAGNQDTPEGKRGASEVKQGKVKGGYVIATVEPWHGDQVVVYTPPTEGEKLWNRHVIDEQLRWGHAVWFADLDGDGYDELIIGVRGLSNNPDPKDRRGVRVYKAVDDKGTKWARQIVDDGGVAVEDLAAADLNGDGRIDLIAVGRQTHNLRIYWNEGKK